MEKLAGDGSFVVLSGRIAEALTRIFYGNFRRRIAIQQEEYFKRAGEMINGRQMALLMHQYFEKGEDQSTLMMQVSQWQARS